MCLGSGVILCLGLTPQRTQYNSGGFLNVNTVTGSQETDFQLTDFLALKVIWTGSTDSIYKIRFSTYTT